MARKTAKRPRTSSAGNTTRTPPVEPKHQQFYEWSRQREVEINGVAPRRLPGKGLGLIATRAIKVDERILFVPELVMFKPDFTRVRKCKLERASSQAKLAFSALVHFDGEDSILRTWYNTWPTVQDFQNSVPMYWNSGVSNSLPPSALKLLERQLSDYAKDWETCQSAVRKSGFVEADFKYYWMIVNSRSFHWAPPKGGPGYMVMCPFIDYMNHGPSGTGCNVFQRSDGYEVTAQRDYEAGEEVTFSYGAHVNEKLLIHYGFMLSYAVTEPVIDDDIRIDDEIASLLSDTVKNQLLDVGYLGPYALVPKTDEDKKTTGWEPCFKTQVAVRATLQTCCEWEFFAGSGEDLSSDCSEEVNRVLAKALRRLTDRATSKLDQVYDPPPDMTPEDFQAAQGAIKQRWQQIQDAVTWFQQQHERR